MLVLALGPGCPEPGAPSDAAVSADTALPPPDGRERLDAGPSMDLGTCSAPRRVVLTLGVDETVTGNTEGGPEGSLNLGACGNPMASPRPPQDVWAVELPGSGPLGVAFDLVEGTPEDFDTVVQVRTSCETPPAAPDACFDDASLREVRSAGAFVATGGTTVYLVVTGFAGGMDTRASGSYTMRLRAEPNEAPELTSASARRVDDDRLEVFVSGADRDANAAGIGVQFLGATGMPVPANSAAPTELGPYFIGFDEEVGSTSFADARVTLPGSAELDGVGTATHVRVFAFDVYGARSATRDVPIEMVTEVGFGQACDAARLCRSPNVCERGMCAASAATRALCDAAMPIVLGPAGGGGAPGVSTHLVTLAAGDGVSSGNGCEFSADADEEVLAVTVPEGAFDLVVSTNLPANPPSLDTIVYVRSTCVDDSTELVCDDDYAGAPEGDVRSMAVLEDVAPGVYYVFVDGYEPFSRPTTVAVELRLRPVLGSGASCDPRGATNRCRSGPCPSSGAPVCP